MPMPVLEDAMCSPGTLAVFDRDTAVSWAEPGDFGANGGDHANAFVAGGGWEVRGERVFAFDCIDI